MADEKKRAVPSSGDANLDNAERRKKRKVPLKWSEALHRDFVSAVFEIGVKHASPAVVLDTMLIQDNEVTPERVKSHLQKYRVHKERSKTEFMDEYDRALRRIKERGGAKWHPTDRFLSGDVAAAMAYYTMNPEVSITMPIDMRMSNVAGPTNVPTPREEYTELTQGGAVYSDQRSASRRGSGHNSSQSHAAGGVPMPSRKIRPVVSSGNLDESSIVYLPNLTEEEFNSALGRKLRKLAEDYNATISNLLEGRKPREEVQRCRSQHSNTQYPIHPQGFVPPDDTAQMSSSASRHQYSSYDYYSQPPLAQAPAPAPVSYSIGKGRGDDRSGGTPSKSNRRYSPVPDFNTNRSSTAASPTASYPGADDQKHHHPSYNSMCYNSNAGPASSPSDQSWTNGYNNKNDNNQNGNPAYNYDHHCQPHHHYDPHDVDTTTNGGTSYTHAHNGQNNGQSLAPHGSSHDYDHWFRRKQNKTPTSRIGGSTDSLDIGDPWDDVDVEYSPIAS